MLLTTVAATAFFGWDMIATAGSSRVQDSWWELARLLVFAGVVGILVYGNVVYQVSRLGYFVRLRHHRPPHYDDLVQAAPDDAAPAVVVLVPSFREDPRTIRQTLLSAAL